MPAKKRLPKTPAPGKTVQLLIYGGEVEASIWRAWTPKFPNHYGEGSTLMKAALDLRRRIEFAASAHEIATKAKANPDRITKEEEVQLDQLGLTGEIRPATLGETVALQIKAMLRSEPGPLFIPPAGTASAYEKLTGRSPAGYAELVHHVGEPKAMEITGRNILKWLSVGAVAGSPGHFQALCSVAAESARDLETARKKQPVLAKANSEEMLGWPLFWSPYLGQEWKGKDGKAYIKEVIESLNLSAKRVWANSRAKETGTAIQTGPEILGRCVKCMQGAVERARAAAKIKTCESIIEHLPWAAEAGTLAELSADGNPAVAKAWFLIAWQALLWAFDGSPEKHAGVGNRNCTKAQRPPIHRAWHAQGIIGKGVDETIRPKARSLGQAV